MLQDECACIGCKQCVWLAQGTFRIEPDHGRSRAFAQWVDVEDNIQVSPDGKTFWSRSSRIEPHRIALSTLQL